MGASASVNKQKIENQMINEAYAECGTNRTTNLVSLSGIQFDPPPDCSPPSEMTINQVALLDGNCLLGSLQKAAAKFSSTMNANAKAGLGFAVSTNVSETENNIRNYTNQKCAGYSTTNTADVKDTIIKSCKFQVVQNATQNVSCQINETQNAISQIAQKAATTAEGGSIFGMIFGSIGGIISIIVVIVIVIIVIILLIYFIRRKKPENETQEEISGETSLSEALVEEKMPPKDITTIASGEITTKGTVQGQEGGRKKHFRCSKITIIIIILVVVAFLILRIRGKRIQKISNDDINLLNQKMSEAQQIAKLIPKPSFQSTQLPTVPSAFDKTTVYYQVSDQDLAPNEVLMDQESQLENYYKLLL